MHAHKLSPCPYSPHPMNRRTVRIDALQSTSGCSWHSRSKSGSSNRSLPSLVFSDADEGDSEDESNLDEIHARADSDALTLTNLKILSVEKFGTRHFDEMKSHYITAPAERNGIKIEIRRGLMVVKKVSTHSPLFGMLLKYDIISSKSHPVLCTSSTAENSLRLPLTLGFLLSQQLMILI